MIRPHFRPLAFAAALCILAGCSERPPAIVPVEGVVLLNGQPVPNAQVRFIPTANLGAEFIAVGVTDEQGRFTLRCNGQAGACAGENRVAIGEADIPKELRSEKAQDELAVYLKSLKNRPIPPVYENVADTPLRVTVAAGQTAKLELVR